MNKVLAKKYPWSCGLVVLLIIASLYFNILALSTKFLTIHHVAISNEIYSLFGAVALMWSYDMYIVAVLIVGFSIIFPFVKLIALFIVCFVVKCAKKRCKTITVIEALAKWSMLDVFVVCILLVLTNDQIFVSSEPEIGVYYFLLAIFISILCAMLVDNLCETTYPAAAQNLSVKLKFVVKHFTSSERIIIITLLILSILFFAFAISFNYIRVSDFFLISNSFSILQTCIALDKVSPILAWFVGFVLILFPIMIFNYTFTFWTTSYHPKFHFAIVQLLKFLGKFMMLDVFFLALILVLLEGHIIISTESMPGLYMLELFVFTSFSLPLFIKFYTKIRYYYFYKNRKPTK
jgi:paraquat-inducible protein A